MRKRAWSALLFRHTKVPEIRLHSVITVRDICHGTDLPGIFSTTNTLERGYLHRPALGKAATSAFAERILRQQEKLAADESERLPNVLDGNSFLWIPQATTELRHRATVSLLDQRPLLYGDEPKQSSSCPP